MSDSIHKQLRPALIVSEKTQRRYAPMVRRILTGLTERGIEMGLICRDTGETNLAESTRILTYPSLDLPLTDWFNRQRLSEQLSAFQPTVLHALGEDSAMLVQQLASQMDIPYVVNVNSLQHRSGQLPLSIHRCAGVIAPCSSIYESLCRTHPRLVERIRLSPMGTEVVTSPRSPSAPVPCIVVAHPFKSTADFKPILHALADLKRRGQDMVVLFVGQGPKESVLRRKLERHSLQSVVTILSDNVSLHAVLEAGDIFVQPAPLFRYNALCLEAMSQGLSIIGCEGGCDDLLVAGGSAVDLFKPRDCVSLRQALERQLAGHASHSHHLDSLHTYLTQHHRTSQMLDALIEDYEYAWSWSYGLKTIA